MPTEDVGRLYACHSIENKWAGNRQALWNEFKDPLKTKDEIRDNVPEGIAQDQRASFVNYGLRDDTQFAQTGRRHGRAQLSLATHKKQDGSYVNEEAKEICEKIQLAMSQSTVDESDISPNDVVGKVLGKEHSGRVRCLGLGATPSTHFKQTKPRVGGFRIPSNDAGCSSFGCQDKYDKLLNTLKAYMIMKERSIPEQFVGIFGSPPTMVKQFAYFNFLLYLLGSSLP
ncbi:uncharacterized protein LOC132037333 [Lycium ferocissimum]|uniref:uncharacterized protein LOC132037333 n=1 Tax=Lycium ferocissimum TaxID=112874 RepID=UPI0028155381|nr:uncharacterized protein LOC132037333 [Lycium ferocissimum]